MRFIVLTILLALVGGSYQQSKPSDDFYYAAVVEFYRDIENISGYMKLLDTEEAKQADIIVFPEASLNKYGPTDVFVPHHDDRVVPCGNTTYNFLADFSCKAKTIKKYVVLNLFEKERCTVESQKAIQDPRPCPESGWYKFNTNVVLDRNGTVIARYRKVHLYGEPGVHTTYKPDIVTFDTDFGVTFGTFICFDILFQTPAQNLTKDKKVTDIVYPVHWRTQLPFFTPLQIQQAWAYANNINLLASGSNDKSLGSTGTGIYAGKHGALTGLVSTSNERTILLAKVPKIGRVTAENILKKEVVGIKSVGNLTFTPDDAIPFYTSQIVEFVNNKELNYRVCQKDLCCSFKIQKTVEPIQHPNSYVYRVGVLNAWMERFNEGSFLKNCGLFTCKDYSPKSCGQIYDYDETVNNDVFQKVVVTGEFPKKSSALIQPNTVDRLLRPIPIESFDFVISDNATHHVVVMQTKGDISNIHNFGIFGNYYDKNSATGILPVFGVLLIGFIFNRIL